MQTATQLLESVIVKPKAGIHEYTIIWLHGLGADGYDFADIVDHLGFPSSNSVKFIFPHAPHRSITINNGMRMRAWYDPCGLELDLRDDLEGISESQQLIMNLINNEIKEGIEGTKIILAGFSQGGAMSIYTGLRSNVQLGGIIALSSYHLMSNLLKQERHQANKDTPIFVAHGTLDAVVPVELGRKCYKQLLELDYSVEFHEYSMQHTVIDDEIKQIGNFIRKIFNY